MCFHIEDVPLEVDEDPDAKPGKEKPDDENPGDQKLGNVAPPKARTAMNQFLRVHRAKV